MATLVGLDADYSVGFTRVYADFVHGRYDRASDSVNATSLTLTAVQYAEPALVVSPRAGHVQTTSDMLRAARRHGHHYYASTVTAAGIGGGWLAGREWEDVGARQCSSPSRAVAAAIGSAPDITFRAG